MNSLGRARPAAVGMTIICGARVRTCRVEEIKVGGNSFSFFFGLRGFFSFLFAESVLPATAARRRRHGTSRPFYPYSGRTVPMPVANFTRTVLLLLLDGDATLTNY